MKNKIGLFAAFALLLIGLNASAWGGYGHGHGGPGWGGGRPPMYPVYPGYPPRPIYPPPVMPPRPIYPPPVVMPPQPVYPPPVIVPPQPVPVPVPVPAPAPLPVPVDPLPDPIDGPIDDPGDLDPLPPPIEQSNPEQSYYCPRAACRMAPPNLPYPASQVRPVALPRTYQIGNRCSVRRIGRSFLEVIQITAEGRQFVLYRGVEQNVRAMMAYYQSNGVCSVR